jgi:phospholipid:diacylglycerol acyltransferase
MNFLRRRNVAESANHNASVSKPEAPETDGEFHILGDKKLEHIVKKPKGGKRRTAWIFALGGIFGLAIAAFFVGPNDYLDLTMFQDLKMDSIFDVLPAGMLREARDFQVSIMDNRGQAITADTAVL